MFIDQMEKWICKPSGCHSVAVTGMHGVTEAQHDSTFKTVLNSADMVVPDGMPLVWLARLKGHELKRRVYGPELMFSFLEATRERNYRHFLYGSAPGVPERLSGNHPAAFSRNNYRRDIFAALPRRDAGRG